MQSIWYDDNIAAKKDVALAIWLVQFLVVFPFLWHLPLSLVSAALLVITFRFFAIKNEWGNLPKWLILTMGVLGVASVLLMFKTPTGKIAGTSLMILMFGFKSLEIYKVRDILLVIILSFFLIAISFLFSQSPWVLLYALLCLLTALAVMIKLSARPNDLSYKKLIRQSGILLLQSLPIMILLFFVFPRFGGSLWQGWKNSAATTGLSDRIYPGAISQLNQSNATAFRVEFKGEAPAEEKMYWRAMTLDHYDGTVWQSRYYPTVTTYRRYIGEAIEYQLTLEPHEQKWIPALDIADEPGNKIDFGWDATLNSKKKILSRKTYALKSYLDYQLNANLSYEQQIANLILPEQGNSKSRALGMQLRNSLPSDKAIVNELLNRIQQQDYYYTLTPELMQENFVDTFWFEKKAGFCEHYASAMTFILRAAGVPARIVMGYQGGSKNPYGDYWLVKQANAHAWVEVWYEGQGWIRVDPTAYIPAERVNLELSNRLNELQDLFGNKIESEGWLKWLSKSRAWMDYMKKAWNDKFLGYGMDEQQDLLKWLGLNQYGRWLITLAIVAIFAVMIIAIALMVLCKRQHQDLIAKHYHQLKQKLMKKGLLLADDWGPEKIQQHACELFPKQAKNIKQVFRLYCRLRYMQLAEARAEKEYLAFKKQVAGLKLQAQ